MHRCKERCRQAASLHRVRPVSADVLRGYGRTAMTDESKPAASRWLLLIHQLPPSPPYLRVKVARRMQRIGAVAIKNTVYVLPTAENNLEDFQWTVREIR